MLLNRRNTLGVAAAALPLVSSVLGARAAEPATSTSFDFASVKTAPQFAAAVIGRADLSRAASEVAVRKLVRADAKEFSEYELLEANTVIAVLRDLGTPLPAMRPDVRAELDAILDAEAGLAFDRAYIGAEYENHASLRDLAAAYLQNSDAGTTDPDERHGRHLATVALFAFTEHTGITRRIAGELAA